MTVFVVFDFATFCDLIFDARRENYYFPVASLYFIFIIFQLDISIV